ncbi:nucleotide disphospho-sugar-binding domain-containing protein [Streptomyces sp. NPDC059639]|uniref:nucleotide disphospho-sugar-binding domain-containing protein n=1 Tax=Streptomyces sp. NPDC059639 TaxID=3346891 RepID=UPI0036D0642B
MRVLMLATPVPTHFTPLVPLAWALRAAGHEVLIAGQPDIMEAVASAGLNGVSIGVGYHIQDDLAAVVEAAPRPRRRDPDGERPTASVGTHWAIHTRYVCELYLRTAEVFRPDLVVSDLLEFSALLVGAAMNVPVVHHRWGVDPLGDVAHAQASENLRLMSRRFGLEELPGPAALLDPCPASLQVPGIRPGVPIRHVPYNGNGRLPPWLEDGRRAVPGGRRVVVSLGGRAVAMNRMPLIRHLLRILGERPDTEVIATVDERHRAEIGPVPGSVRMVAGLPLNLLLGTCDAVVHHGGAGTSMVATAFGLPQLVLPQFADQFAHGERLAASGAAIGLTDEDGQNEPAVLRDALTKLLTDSSYGEAARSLGTEMAAMPSPAQVVPDLERLEPSHRSLP